MSFINVPGYLLGDMNQALLNAFPSKYKLQRMVRFQFSKNLDDIALGENLDEIAYKLVEHFEKQNQLEKLIKGALKANTNNPGLKKIVKKTHITISLLEILQPLEDKYLEEMQRAAYEACYSENHLDLCWKNNTLDSLNDILTGIDNIPQKENHEQPILQFVVRFLVEVQNKLPSGEEENLRQWCEDNFNDFSQLLEQIKNERLQREEQKKNTSIDAKGQRLILLVSDCISTAWRDKWIHPVLHLWGNKSLLAILQLLPECLDDSHGSYKGAPIDGNALLHKNDNLFLARGRAIIQGGSWSNNPNKCRSAYCNSRDRSAGRNYVVNNIGFRVVCAFEGYIK